MPHLAPYPGTQSARRAVALLKAFASGGPRSLTQLARRLRLNKATVYRLLTALESEGLLTREAESGAYRLGAEAIALGWQAIRSNDLVRTIHPELETLVRRTRDTATLEILTGRQVLILDEVTAGRRVEIDSSVGSRWPAHATSTGKVLLAHLPAGELRRALARPLARFTDRTLTSRRLLIQQLSEARRRGYAEAVEELEPGFVAVAAPVFRHDGAVVAAISVGGPTARMPPDRLPELAGRVARHAARASRTLGYRQARRLTPQASSLKPRAADRRRRATRGAP
ncbi:MAG: IclR family transcriptional regulator [Anaerolineales bacterium]